MSRTRPLSLRRTLAQAPGTRGHTGAHLGLLPVGESGCGPRGLGCPTGSGC